MLKERESLFTFVSVGQICRIFTFHYSSIDPSVVGNGSADPEYDRIEEKEITLDMYTEDTRDTSCEDPLEAALTLHDLQNAKDTQDNRSTDWIVASLGEDSLAFANYTYDTGLESTEIQLECA